MLFKRAGSAVWYARYRDAGGKRVKRSTGTTDRREAGELEGKWRLEARQQRLWGIQPRFTFDELMLRYLKETQGTKRSAERDVWTVKRLQPYFTPLQLRLLANILIELFVNCSGLNFFCDCFAR